MTDHLELRPVADLEAWDAAVAAHPDGSPFHLSGFLLTYGRLSGCRVHLLEATTADGSVGLVPLVVRGRGPVVQVNAALPISYLGPLLPPGWDPQHVLDAVRGYLRPRHVVQFELRSLQPLEAPAAPGWATHQWTRAAIPVVGGDDDALLSRFLPRQRTTYRRALRLGVTTGPATREEIGEYFPRWSAAPLVRQGLPSRWPAGLHLAVHDALAPSGVAVTTAVRDESGQLIGLGTSLALGDRVTAWEMGVNEEGRSAGAFTMLYVDGMRRARDLGGADLDVLGAPTPGIESYKRSLGAEMLPRGVVEWCSPIAPAVQSVADAARRPTGLVRRLAGRSAA